MGDGSDRRTSRLTWARLITTLCAGLASTSGNASTDTASAPATTDPPSVETRIRAVREALTARIADSAEPAEESSQEVAQWRNFPNFPNFPNWRNW